MTKKLSHTKEQSLLDSFLSSRVEAKFTEDEQGNPIISSISIGGMEMSPEIMKDDETLNTFFNLLPAIRKQRSSAY